MTPRQKELARHAFGLDGRRKQSYGDVILDEPY